MGIDEIHLIKPRCVVSNIANNTIVDMLPNRNKDTVAKYLTNMPNKGMIQYVAMDMWTPYRDAVQAVVPDARIVIDKFHVVRMANDAVEKVRKSLRADLSAKERRGLMHDRFVLLKRQHDLTDKEAFNLDGWTKNYPVLGEAYRLKEAFYEIYDAATPGEAMRRYEAWYRSITPENREPYSDLIRAWSNWQPYILNHFDHNITSGYVECLNSLIRVMNRLGRGYSFEALRAKILFTKVLINTSCRARSSNASGNLNRLIGLPRRLSGTVCRVIHGHWMPSKSFRRNCQRRSTHTNNQANRRTMEPI
jgi:transposase